VTSDVEIGEAEWDAGTLVDGLEEVEVDGGAWVKASIASAVAMDGLSELMKELVMGGGVVNDREGVEEAEVGGEGDFGVAIEVGNALGHRKPGLTDLAISCTCPVDLEVVGTVDDGLDPEDTAGLVIHFDGVLLDAVFHASARPTSSVFAGEVALELRGELFAEEGEDVLWLEGDDIMLEELWVDRLEVVDLVEEHVGGELRLFSDPVVVHVLQ
jgi:hypothetical protein